MADTPAPTPPPRPLVAAEDEASQASRLRHECPYRDEIHLVRRLQRLGVEEQAVIGRRRDRVALALAGAALAAALTLGGAAIVGGLDLAREVGASETRLDQVERRGQSTDSALIQLGRLEARLEGLEGRLGERLDDLARRLDRAEDRAIASGRSRSRRR